MHQKLPLSHSRFWLEWTLLTSIGYALGFLAGFIVGHFLLGNVMIGVGIGLGAGLAQRLVLGRFGLRAPAWEIASTIGIAAPLGLYALVHAVAGYPFHLGWPWGILGWAVALGAGGALLGFWQQRILPSQLSGANWWIVAHALAWSFSALGLAIPPDMSGQYSGFLWPLLVVRNGLLAPAVAGLILGTLTGGAFLATQARRSLNWSS